MKEIKLKVEGMKCEGCENQIKKVIGEIANIEEVTANHKSGEVTIKASAPLNIDSIKEKINDLSFEVK